MPKYSDEVKAKCVEKVKQSVALATITKELGPNPKAIQRYCKKAGVDIPKKKKAEKAEKAPKAPPANQKK